MPTGSSNPIRRLQACSLSSGARDTAVIATSWFSRLTPKPYKPSPIAEKARQPAGSLLLLLVATTLAVYKPPGLTPHGQRKQREQQMVSR